MLPVSVLVPLLASMLAVPTAPVPAATSSPDVRIDRVAEVVVEARDPGDWEGSLSFGLTATVNDRGRVWRQAPTRVSLERETCDDLGCLRTVLTLDGGMVLRTRVGTGLRSASLGPAATAFTVTRWLDGVLVSESVVLLDLHAHLTALAPPSETVEEDSIDGRRRVVLDRRAPARARIVLAGTELDAGTATIAVTRTTLHP